MISGVVNASHDATIRLPIEAADGRRRASWSPSSIQGSVTILDTGFNGSLTLPPDLIADLELPWRTRSLVILANGAQEPCDVYAATIIWDGRPRRILVEAADTDPLIGMALLHGHDVRMQVVAGGAVVIEALSQPV